MARTLLRVADGAADGLALAVRWTAPLALRPLRLWRLARLRAGVEGRVPVTTQFDGRIFTSGRVRLRLGEHCRLGRGVFFETRENGSITLGRHVRINAGVTVVSNAAVSIGDDCLIGEYVSIRDANHGMRPGPPMRTQGHTSAPILIGSDVWIGRGAAILRGVSIGSGAVVAANSVVTEDVAEGMIVAGAPARVIGERGAGKTRRGVEGGPVLAV